MSETNTSDTSVFIKGTPGRKKIYDVDYRQHVKDVKYNLKYYNDLNNLIVQQNLSFLRNYLLLSVDLIEMQISCDKLTVIKEYKNLETRN